MTIKEMLEQHPKTTTIIKGWFMEKMLESFKDKKIPEAFKKAMKGENIQDENLSIIIEANPRVLFDVFDENEVYIGITFVISSPVKFNFTVGREIQETRNTRREAEREAIEKAFEILEEKLCKI